jgi:hypothetical protein
LALIACQSLGLIFKSWKQKKSRGNGLGSSLQPLHLIRGVSPRETQKTTSSQCIVFRSLSFPFLSFPNSIPFSKPRIPNRGEQK